MTANNHHKTTPSAETPVGAMRYALIAVLVMAAFFGAYRFAQASRAAQGASPAEASRPAAVVGAGADASAEGGGCGGGCCGGDSGAQVEGAAKVSGGVQKIDVDLSTGSYNPNVIKLKAGVPAEITFGQSAGCTAAVQSADLGFSEDLTSGPKTVKLDGLQPGTYGFACGMDMVTGQIVVE